MLLAFVVYVAIIIGVGWFFGYVVGYHFGYRAGYNQGTSDEEREP